ncbi:MAG: Hsp20/alpha crystallin family protein [Syntrophales bacterium]|nr:Hsp20/alpha crystallin family protein [Syntrophales bacterium]MDY0044198.1 Hsp20/alpha crystallin family protein [Syntrophales bacterium]
MWLTGLHDVNWMPDIWRNLDQMQQEMDRLLTGQTVNYLQSFPAINMWMSENDVILSSEIPGIDPGDINISLEGDVLDLSGSRISEGLKEGGKYHRQERPHGAFKRKIRLPFHAQEDRIEAIYEKGILTIKIPRAEEEKPRKITVKAE